MLSILNLTKTNKLILATFAFLAVLAFGGGRAHAATLNVVGGCTLPIAINSVNAGANQSGCTATVSPDGYGTNDTIAIPAGTVTLAANLPAINESVIIQGAGMSNTIISGNNGQYDIFDAFSLTDVTIKDLQITAFNNYAINTNNCNVILSGIEINGEDVNSTRGDSILLSSSGSGTYTIDVDDVYAHDINSNGGFSILRVERQGNGTVNANLNNITLSSIHGTAIGDSIFGVVSIAFGGTVNTTISNVTIDDFTGDDNAIPFGSFGAADGGTATVNTQVQNVTITGLRGKTGTGGSAGVKSAAFYSAAAAMQPGDQARATVDVTNSLMADNLNDNDSSNCTEVDLTSLIGGAGTDSVAVINSLGHNISDDASCTQFAESGDQQNVSNIISTLGPLQDNGGAVPTRALLPGSPAISAGGSVLGVTTDARGIARPNACPSVGAFQFEGAVCGASTPSTSGSGNAGAPNTGANSVSLVGSLFASFAGLLTLGYVFARKRA